MLNICCMKKLLPLLLCLPLLVACGGNSRKTFTLSGSVTNSAEKTLYLYELVDEFKFVDSVVCDSKGNFQLNTSLQQDSLIYYFGHSGNGVFFTANANDVIKVSFDYNNREQPLTIEGGGPSNKQFEGIQLITRAIDREGTRIYQQHKDGHISIGKARILVDSVLKSQKNLLFEQYILPAPNTLEAYFALLQKVANGNAIFPLDPLSPEPIDIHALGMVATAFDVHRPNSVYTQGIKREAMRAIKTNKLNKHSKLSKLLDQADQRTFPSIELPDSKGNRVNLDQLLKQHSRVGVIFVSFADEKTGSFIVELRERYNQRRDKGMELLMISYDIDIPLWRNATRTLPWVNALDQGGERTAVLYNVHSYPTMYEITPNQVRRVSSIKELLP